jgi:hypothetical protein
MKWLAIIAALTVAGVVGFMSLYPSVTKRYRLTIEAEVDGQPKTGSSVIEVTWRKQPRIGESPSLIYGSRGEAVVVDLGARGALFALLRAGDDIRSAPETIILRAFDYPGGIFQGPPDEALRHFDRLSGKRELSLTSLPMLVRFRDLNDPKTVEQVDPLNIARNFGAGTKLVRATLEIVSAGIWPFNRYGMSGEPITTGIEKRLSWLPSHYNLKFDGQRYETASSALPLANSLSSGAFKLGPQS